MSLLYFGGNNSKLGACSYRLLAKHCDSEHDLMTVNVHLLPLYRMCTDEAIINI